MNSLEKEKGVGLIEVLLALAILLFTALSVSTVQSTQMINTIRSSDHFSLDALSNNMLDTLRTWRSAAAAGSFNYDAEAGTEFSSDTTDSAQSIAVDWNDQIVQSLPSGLGAIQCTPDICNVTISWSAEIDGEYKRQYFRASTPL